MLRKEPSAPIFGRHCPSLSALSALSARPTWPPRPPQGGLGLEMAGPADQSVYIMLENKEGTAFDALPFFPVSAAPKDEVCPPLLSCPLCLAAPHAPAHALCFALVLLL